MKQLYLVKNGPADKAFEERENPIPKLNTREVLVKVETFGINFADIMARLGLYREAPPLPCVIGYEVCGVVEQVGSDTLEPLKGKKVVAFTRFGGYSEYVKTEATAVIPIPDEVDSTEACALATQYGTAYYAAYECANLRKGENVLVHSAAGGVGIALTQLAKLKGCTVFGTASTEKKLQVAKENGADYVINYQSEDYQKAIEKIIGKQQLDVAFNAVGGKTFKQDMALLNAGGREVLYGAAKRSGQKWGMLSTLKLVWDMGLVIPLFAVMTSKSILGVNMLKIGDNKPELLKHCLDEVVKLRINNQIKPLIGAVYEAKDIAKAHTLVEDRSSVGKVVVKW